MVLSERQPLPLPSQLGLLAALASGGLLGAAYYFQYVVGLAPCELCLLQRWPHMVGGLALLIRSLCQSCWSVGKAVAEWGSARLAPRLTAWSSSQRSTTSNLWTHTSRRSATAGAPTVSCRQNSSVRDSG